MRAEMILERQYTTPRLYIHHSRMDALAQKKGHMSPGTLHHYFKSGSCLLQNVRIVAELVRHNA